MDEPLRELDYEVLSDDQGMRLDLFLNDRMVWRSRSSIRKLIETGKVRIKTSLEGGGRSLKPSRKVRSGEIFGVAIPKPRRDLESSDSQVGEDIEIPVLYEDEWILVVDKPPNIPVHPGGRLLERTVITLLNERCKESRSGMPPLKLCHRLDLETSGVLLIAKDSVAMPGFASQFEKREAKKEYLALVHGEMEEDRGEIDLPIGLARDSRINMKRGIDFTSGQPARTGFQVEKRFKEFTLVRLRLYTGRHHQLRVHLSAKGHPIVGDKAYGLDENLFILYHEDRLDDEAREKLILPRQALHAVRLTIYHVPLDKPVSFEAPLPGDIRAFMETLPRP